MRRALCAFLWGALMNCDAFMVSSRPILASRAFARRSRISRILGTDDSFKHEYYKVLKERIDSVPLAVDMGSFEEVFESSDLASHVWILIFEETERSIYTLKKGDDEIFVVVFEDYDEAERFSGLLEAEAFGASRPTRWSVERLHDFCDENTLRIGFIPKGSMIRPP